MGRKQGGRRFFPASRCRARGRFLGLNLGEDDSEREGGWSMSLWERFNRRIRPGINDGRIRPAPRLGLRAELLEGRVAPATLQFTGGSIDFQTAADYHYISSGQG